MFHLVEELLIAKNIAKISDSLIHFHLSAYFKH